MTISSISTLPAAPDRTDAPATFVSKADAMIAALVSMITELNTSISQMNIEFTSTYYDGAWSSATGAKTAPQIYQHNNALWLLLNDAADITATEPAVSNADYLLIGNSPAGEQVLQTLSTTTPTWSFGDGPGAEIQLSGNTTITLSGEPAGSVIIFRYLEVQQDGSGSGYTLGFTGATIKTEEGAGLPSLTATANAKDALVLWSLDNGTSYTVRRVARNISA